MMLNIQEQDELRDLAWGYHEGTLSADQAARLEQLVLRDPEACTLFVCWSTMVNDLEWQCASIDPADVSLATTKQSDLLPAPSAAAEANLPVLSFIGKIFSASHNINVPLFFTILLVAMAAGAGLAVWWIKSEHGPDPGMHVADVPAAGNAERGNGSLYSTTLVNVTNCRWDRALSSADLRSGGTLRPGESLRLLEGVAEINVVSLEGGETRIQLEGPSAMVLTNSGMPSLFYGKLSAVFAGSRDQYMIDTLLGQINVIGAAAIGVIAGNSEVQLHVFAGQVAFDSVRPLRGESKAYRWSVSAGDSIRLIDSADTDILVKRGQADEHSFANPSSITARQLFVSEAYVAEIRQASPIAYWRFEEMTDGVVRNEMGNRFHCRIMGNGVRLHSYDGNRSAELGMTAESGYLLSDDLLEGIDGDGYTIEAWVKPSCYHLGVVFRLYDGIAIDRANVVHLELTGPITGPVDQPMPPWTKYPGRFRFMHAGESCYSEQPYRLSEWQHLAAAKDGSKMRLYIDGKLISEGESATKFDCGFPVLIGQLQPKPQGFGYPPRRFIGELDEIALYDRALSEEEIKKRVTMVEMAGSRHLLLSPGSY